MDMGLDQVSEGAGAERISGPAQAGSVDPGAAASTG